MREKVTNPVDNGEGEVFIDDGYEELPSEVLNVDTHSSSTEKSTFESKTDTKLVAKKRMDDYLERKWFKDQGWDDDDELFSDEYFSDADI